MSFRGVREQRPLSEPQEVLFLSFSVLVPSFSQGGGGGGGGATPARDTEMLEARPSQIPNPPSDPKGCSGMAGVPPTLTVREPVTRRNRSHPTRLPPQGPSRTAPRDWQCSACPTHANTPHAAPLSTRPPAVWGPSHKVSANTLRGRCSSDVLSSALFGSPHRGLI